MICIFSSVWKSRFHSLIRAKGKATGMRAEIKRWKNKLETRSLRKITQKPDRKTTFGHKNVTKKPKIDTFIIKKENSAKT